jgi:hypothetical protein
MKAIALLIVVAGILPLSAQDTGLDGVGGLAGYNLFSGQSGFGFQAFAVMPESDLHSAVGGRTGYEVGIHTTVGIDTASELRPRFDYTRLDGGSFSSTNATSTTTINGLSLGVDYLYYFQGTRTGMYGMAGANIAWWECQNRFVANTRQTSPTFLIGPGFRFSKGFAAELEFEFGQFRPSEGTDSSIKLGGVVDF